MRQLFHFSLSPACRKIRLLLAEKGLGFQLLSVNFWERPQELMTLNPAGEIPVLVEENGEIICGGYALTEYLEEKHSSPTLIGKTLQERAEIRRLMDWFDGKFEQEVTRNLVYEKVFKRLARIGSPDTQALREGKKAIQHHMEYLSYCLQDQPWLAGDAMTLADLTAGAHLSVIDYLGDLPWANYPEVRQWYAILKSRPGFRIVLADRITGISPPPHYDNPDF
jgi:glutathione S-transferase